MHPPKLSSDVLPLGQPFLIVLTKCDLSLFETPILFTVIFFYLLLYLPPLF